jgi:alkanesulfonate monooxygenase SsuD/methylene tetrahydromethanopterin reductase-like flavin-dependent oxidoreductase (luciferase family)
MELAVQTVGPYERVLELAHWAEDRGLRAMAVPDHYLYGDAEQGNPAPDAFVHLAGLARDTSRIELVSLVSPVTFRHPAVHAKAAISIDRMSGGRFTLGLGTGWMDAEHDLFGIPYPDLAARYEMLEEQLQYVAAVRDNKPFGGTRYQLADFDIQPRPTGPLKLLVGGAGPTKTPRLAGLYADEFNAYAQPPAALEERIGTARRHARDAGRGEDALFLSTACVPVIGSTQAGYETAKEWAAEMFATPLDEIEERLEAAGVLHGTPPQVHETMAAWSELGIERYYVQRPGKDEAEREQMFTVLETAASSL